MMACFAGCAAAGTAGCAVPALLFAAPACAGCAVVAAAGLAPVAVFNVLARFEKVPAIPRFAPAPAPAVAAAAAPSPYSTTAWLQAATGKPASNRIRNVLMSAPLARFYSLREGKGTLSNVIGSSWWPALAVS